MHYTWVSMPRHGFSLDVYRQQQYVYLLVANGSVVPLGLYSNRQRQPFTLAVERSNSARFLQQRASKSKLGRVSSTIFSDHNLIFFAALLPLNKYSIMRGLEQRECREVDQ
jgi:hypothetical protein